MNKRQKVVLRKQRWNPSKGGKCYRKNHKKKKALYNHIKDKSRWYLRMCDVHRELKKRVENGEEEQLRRWVIKMRPVNYSIRKGQFHFKKWYYKIKKVNRQIRA